MTLPTPFYLNKEICLDYISIVNYIDTEISLANKYQNYSNLEKVFLFVKSPEFYTFLLKQKSVLI